ncbi:MAG: leucine-rich repeat protein [Clostridia bacterium]|nr:leucine-rich repeat protein [Clostridia bacterium]
MKKLGVVLLFGLTLLTLSLFGCKVKKYDIENELIVEYVIGDEIYQSATVTRGACLSAPTISDRSGYIFDGWYSSCEYINLWDFDSELYRDITLYGRWLSEIDDFAEVVFKDGNEILHTQTVQKGKCTKEFLPEDSKTGYTYDYWQLEGERFDFSTAIYNDVSLNVVWKLKEYFIDFYCDGVKIDRRTFTIADTSINEPQVPYKENYDGTWSKYELTANNIRVDAIYTPSVMHIRYFALNEVVAEKKYTCVDKDYPEMPQVPKLAGHKGEWKNFEIIGNTVNVFAVYETLTYMLVYIAGGFPIDSLTYTYSDIPVEAPTIPPKLGYSGKWESFEFTEETIIFINAVYTPLAYSAKFVADGVEIANVPFNMENQTFDVPNVPQKEGYIAAWEEYKLSSCNLVINAVYTPINYTITFIDDGKIVSIQTFNAENMFVIPPPLENKYDFECAWESYSLGFRNIIVNAVYVPIKKEDGLIYTLSDDGLSYIVTGYNGLDKHVTIPQFYNDLPIKRIGSKAFAFCDLKSVEISDGIEVIEERAFFGCSLCKVNLPRTLKMIENYAFAESGLTKITVYGNIGEFAFKDCTKLSTVTITSTVNVIAPYALSGCAELKYLKFEAPENWAVSKDSEAIVGNIPVNKLADGNIAATLYEPMSNYYWMKSSAVT